MSANSLHWKALNINGKVIKKKDRAALRCEWKGSGYVKSKRCLLPLQENKFPRCHLYIWAHEMETIHLQVEMDISSMSYTSPESASGLACIIFKVSLNRHASWAKNSGKSSPPIFFYNCRTPFPQAIHGVVKSV
jgi:hypothetical protein